MQNNFPPKYNSGIAAKTLSILEILKSYRNTKIRQAKKGKSFETFGRRWRQNSYRTKLQSCTYTYEVYFLRRLDKRSKRARLATS